MGSQEETRLMTKLIIKGKEEVYCDRCGVRHRGEENEPQDTDKEFTWASYINCGKGHHYLICPTCNKIGSKPNYPGAGPMESSPEHLCPICDQRKCKCGRELVPIQVCIVCLKPEGNCTCRRKAQQGEEVRDK
jgi:hypothetical protein